MTPAAKDWGITLLRLWIGFLIFHAGIESADRAFRSVHGLPSLFSLWSGSLQSLADHLVVLIMVVGGACILVGLAVRVAAFFTTLGLLYVVWQTGGLRPEALLTFDPLRTTVLVGSVAFLLTGPGMLNLGRVFQKKR